VQVADALRVGIHEFYVVAQVIGKVAGVQAQVGVLGIGFGQESLDLGIGADVTIRVTVELLADTVLFPERLT